MPPAQKKRSISKHHQFQKKRRVVVGAENPVLERPGGADGTGGIGVRDEEFNRQRRVHLIRDA